MPDKNINDVDIPNDSQYRYWAFISYSHKNIEAARKLQKKLERYSIPRDLVGRPSRDGITPKRIYPVFLDRNDFSSAHNLDDATKYALDRSRYLIVLCSPSAVRSEFVNKEIEYFKVSSSEKRIHAMILDGEPNATSKHQECYPFALRYNQKPDGSIVARNTPLAADARHNGDGEHYAFLKIVSGIIDADLDDLVRRDNLRKRWLTIYATGALATAITITLSAWVLFADAKIGVPFGGLIRDKLDANGWTVFRPPLSNRSMATIVNELNDRLRILLISRQANDGRFKFSAKPSVSGENWSTAQVLAGLSRMPNIAHKNFGEIREGFFNMYERFDENAKKSYYGWAHKTGEPPQGAITLWMLSALALILTNEEILSETDQAFLNNRYNQTVNAMKQLYPIDDGGWNMFPNTLDPSQHDTYTSVLALDALLNSKNAGLDIRIRSANHDQLIIKTATWLLSSYFDDGTIKGWTRRKNDDEKLVYDGLTLQIYALLLDAEHWGYIELPNSLIKNITRHLILCGERDVFFPLMAAQFFYSVEIDGQSRDLSESVKFLWYPWAIKSAAYWLRRIDRFPVSTLDKTQVQRTLKHLVEDLSDAYITKFQSDYTFISAELLYNLHDIQQ